MKNTVTKSEQDRQASKYFRKWLDATPPDTGCNQQIKMQITASLAREEWLAISDKANEFGVTLDELCGAFVARAGEALATDGAIDLNKEDILLYTRGLKD